MLILEVSDINIYHIEDLILLSISFLGSYLFKESKEVRLSKFPFLQNQ